MIASEPTTTTCEVERRRDGFEPICHRHRQPIGTCIRALEEERDAIKQFAAEEIVRHSLTIRERDGLRAFQVRIADAFRISKEQSKRPFFAGQRLRRLVREALEDFDRIRAALDGEGKP